VGVPRGICIAVKKKGYFFTSISDPDEFARVFFTGNINAKFKSGESDIFFTKNGKVIMRNTPNISIPEIFYASKFGQLYETLNIFYAREDGVVFDQPNLDE